MGSKVLVVTNPHSPVTREAGEVAVRALEQAGVEVVFDLESTPAAEVGAAIVLGGDGTMLHAAQLTYGTGIPLLGVNLGRVGFLAELERDGVADAVQRLAQGDFTVETRDTLEMTVTRSDGSTESGWALNEVTIERANPRRTLEVVVEVDGVPLSSFGCDGVIASTATGSTAHAFSAGGPVIWPNVKALLFVPLAAHALFARPLVLGPQSVLALEVRDSSQSPGHVVCDGARSVDVDPGGRVEVRYGDTAVHLARLSDAPFTERLVRKFSLPTDGWRGERAAPVAGIPPTPALPEEDG